MAQEYGIQLIKKLRCNEKPIILNEAYISGLKSKEKGQKLQKPEQNPLFRDNSDVAIWDAYEFCEDWVELGSPKDGALLYKPSNPLRHLPSTQLLIIDLEVVIIEKELSGI